MSLAGRGLTSKGAARAAAARAGVMTPSSSMREMTQLRRSTAAARLRTGVVVVGRLGHGGEVGGLGQGELRERLAEVRKGGGGDTVGASAEIDLVEVELKDALLGERALQAERKDGLADLAFVGDLFAQEEVGRDLLGDGGSPDRAAPGAGVAQVGQGRTDDGVRIHAEMALEGLVFSRDEGLAHQRGDGGDGHEDAPLLGELGEEASVGGIQAGEHRRAVGPPAGGTRAGRVRSDRRARSRRRRRAAKTKSPPVSRSMQRAARWRMAEGRRAEGAERKGGASRASGAAKARPPAPSPGPPPAPA